jgi:hypothetical protein
MSGILKIGGKTLATADQINDVIDITNVGNLSYVNHPIFFSYLGNVQSNFTDQSYVKVAYDTIEIDSHNSFDILTNIGRYTIPNNCGGTYQISAKVTGWATTDTNLRDDHLYLRKNGSNYEGVANRWSGNDIAHHSNVLTTIMNLNAGDYLEIYCFMNSVNSADNKVLSKMGDYNLNSGWEEISRLTTFSGYRIR